MIPKEFLFYVFLIAEWGIDGNGQGKAASLRVAELAGCPLTPYTSLLNCVRNIDAVTLTEAYFRFQAEDMLQGGLGFSASNPVIQVAGAQRIIEVPPSVLYASGNYTTVPA